MADVFHEQVRNKPILQWKIILNKGFNNTGLVECSMLCLIIENFEHINFDLRAERIKSITSRACFSSFIENLSIN